MVGRIQLMPSEDAGERRVLIEMDPAGLAALRQVLDGLPAQGVVGGSSVLVGADLSMFGVALPATFVVVEKLQEFCPTKPRASRKDMLIAGVIVVACLSLILAAFVAPKRKAALPSDQSKPASVP